MRRTSRNNAVCFESLEQALARSPETYGHLDLIAFGFPCTDISVANPKGKGLKGEKSSIFFECMRVVQMLCPKWILIENVPRLLSINNGRDMATVLQTLAKSGYWWAYRVLDSQFFGLAQRRKRVFIVGSFGNTGASQILSEQESGSRNDEKKSKIWERGLCISTRDGEGKDPTTETYILNTITAKSYGDKGWAPANEWNTIVAQTLGATPRGNSSFVWQDTHIAEINTDRKRETPGISEKFHARKRIKSYDTQRGIVIGNAVSVPVAEWIGKRIISYENKNTVSIPLC